MKTSCFIPCCFFLLIAISTCLADHNYTGPDGGSWHDPANWDPPSVPGASDRVDIPPGSTVDLEGGGECGFLNNEGTMQNTGNLNVADVLINSGSMERAENINTGGNLHNTGEISGPYLLNMNVDGELFFNDEDGLISAFAINIDAENADLANDGSITVNQGIRVSADGIQNSGNINGKLVHLWAKRHSFENHGAVTTIGGTSPGGMGEDILIVAVNEAGTGEFINYGTIEGGDGDPGQGGDNIVVNVDNFENRGEIRPGRNGSGTGVYGGNASINAKVVLTYPGGGVLAYTDSDGTTNVLIVADGIHMWSTYRSEFRSSADTQFRGNNISLAGRQIILENLADSSIIATDYIELIAIDSPGNVIDFSEVIGDRVIVANPTGDILIMGDSLIAPPIGYNAMCEPDPTVSSGSIPIEEVSIFGASVMSFTGHDDSLQVLIRNEHSYSRAFNYTITSQLGWFTAVSGSTPTLAPWETHIFYVDFSVPSGLSSTTIDTVTSEITGLLWPTESISEIIAFPFDTLPTPVSVEENNPNLPEILTISAWPNPFNPAVTISIEGVGDGSPLPVSVEIYDVNGRRIAQLPVGEGLVPSRTTGDHKGLPYETTWRPAPSLPSGVYLVRANTDGGTAVTKHVVYLK